MKRVWLVCFAFVVLFLVSGGMADQEIAVIAKQYDFLPRQIVVEQGKPVKLFLTSVDVDHGFAIKGLKLDAKLKKGEITTVEFTPDQVGEYEIKCSVFCGAGHMGMKGKLVVVEGMKMDHEKMKMPMMNKDSTMCH